MLSLIIITFDLHALLVIISCYTICSILCALIK
ncbi:hypothetical protein CG401_04280 [Bifidobacteriaceae bacterium NR019]|uniref:Uncharacterized protein n=2 Tax=Gardnerella TaxID=2701 RepID=A0AAP8IU47_GARVA|nr:hypothetical protein CYJ60_00885 [Gardnerella vaginalis]RFT32362.1 hypothetical protein CG404_01425 [Bifidobacteriaceae bacterium VN003]RFT33737.1 hypothetical protein CG401_04280 [Bifidobacteriaceae bacterium NR019]RFT35393.1 hypothetical protein CG400_02385 [Bifidobacteriaceae bacterium NR017]RIY27644.1 hypothetical protein CJI52_05025 [Bifidobacteriaceae bacterium WP022]RIY29447.1 hypothetical protein CJI48_04605 [Bifidobacteriaceae bacterium GH005]